MTGADDPRAGAAATTANSQAGPMAGRTVEAGIDWAAIRADFPALNRRVGEDVPLVYLDTGATAQKPRAVLDAMDDFYLHHNGAVHRGAHTLAEEATDAFESARATVAGFVGADADELFFAANATAGINDLAYAIGNASLGRGGAGAAKRFALKPGDEIVVTQAEHHANLVPWQELAARTGATLRWIDVDPATGRLCTRQLDDVVGEHTRILAFTHASNVTGAVTDVPAFVAAAHAVGALAVCDATQSTPHMPVDFHALGVDFAAIAGHKMYGPTGIGGLYGRRELLADLPPAMMGGSMIEVVTMRETTFLPPPQRFEAGTQAVAEAVGWAEACRYLRRVGMVNVAAHEAALASALLAGVADLPGVRVLGPLDAANRLAVLSFDVEGVHPHDVGQLLDAAGVAVRVGHHCAQPVHRVFGTHASTRATAGIYSNQADIDVFCEALAGVRSYFGVA